MMGVAGVAASASAPSAAGVVPLFRLLLPDFFPAAACACVSFILAICVLPCAHLCLCVLGVLLLRRRLV